MTPSVSFTEAELQLIISCLGNARDSEHSDGRHIYSREQCIEIDRLLACFHRLTQGNFKHG